VTVGIGFFWALIVSVIATSLHSTPGSMIEPRHGSWRNGGREAKEVFNGESAGREVGNG
jgi:hypothetical protein